MSTVADEATLTAQSYFIMGDDLVDSGILPVGNITADDEDPNMVESDDFLDDPEDVLIPEVAGIPADALADEDDDDLLEDE